MDRLGRAGRLLQAGALYGLFILLPFSKAAIEIGFGLLALGWVLERLDRRRRMITIWQSVGLRSVAWAALVYLVVCALSILVSEFPEKSVRGVVSKWLEYLLLFAIAADLGSRRGLLERGLVLLAGSAVAVVAQGLVQELTLAWCRAQNMAYPVHPSGAYAQMTGPYENPIDLATYLMVVVPVLLAYALTRSRWRRRLLIGVSVVLVAGLGRTEAVGAWLGFAIGVVVVACQEPGIWRAAAPVLAALMLAAGAFLRLTGHAASVALAGIGINDRWVMWQAALGMIRDRPLLGHGVNTFMANYLRYRVGGEHQPRYAHNCYLQVAAETGAIGLAAFLWLLWSVWARLRAGIRASSGQDRRLLLGLSAGLVAFVVQAGFDTNFYALRQAALFWVLAGLAVGVSERPSTPLGTLVLSLSKGERAGASAG